MGGFACLDQKLLMYLYLYLLLHLVILPLTWLVQLVKTLCKSPLQNVGIENYL